MTPEASLPCSQEPATEPHGFNALSLLLFHVRFSISYCLCTCLPRGLTGILFLTSRIRDTLVFCVSVMYLVRCWSRQVSAVLFTFYRSDFNNKSVLIFWLQPQGATVFDYLFLKGSTCFGRFLRPSSGARNCTFICRYCQPILMQADTGLQVTVSSSFLYSGLYRHYVWWQCLAACCIQSCTATMCGDSV